jgi:hypothetical protein
MTYIIRGLSIFAIDPLFDQRIIICNLQDLQP